MWGSYGVYTHNGKKSVSGKLKSIITQVACENVGEVIINNIDRDGMMKGYDHELIKIFRNTIKGPLTVLEGLARLKISSMSFLNLVSLALVLAAFSCLMENIKRC